jgi:hypothetical protein
MPLTFRHALSFALPNAGRPDPWAAVRSGKRSVRRRLRRTELAYLARQLSGDPGRRPLQ